MSPPGPVRHRIGWRAVTTATTGLLAGVCGVVLVRTFFGPHVVLAGTLVGLVGLSAGLAYSWSGVTRRVARRGTGPALPDGRPLRRWTHPVAWWGPVIGSAVTVLAWGGVARSSGAGWVQAVGALLAAVLVAGLTAPWFAARRAAVTCTNSPSDAAAGSPVTVELEANAPIRVRPLFPSGPAQLAAGPPRGARAVAVRVVPGRRGVVERVVVELASCAPFGLLWWAREVEVLLPRPLHVAPRHGDPGPVERQPDDRSGESDRRLASVTGEPRGIRPFRAGDSRRSVHWPATSHVGALMVREREHETAEPLLVDVDLPADPDAAEAVAEQVMAGVSGHLRRGRVVVLATLESGGRCVRPVRDRIDLGRRLARAVSPPLDHGSGRAGADRQDWPPIEVDRP